jgi:hypothetical protein
MSWRARSKSVSVLFSELNWLPPGLVWLSPGLDRLLSGLESFGTLSTTAVAGIATFISTPRAGG